jgi:phosphopantothenoylcysteine decarboxylase/phosphopantothenate--cysteine ligase
MVLNGPQAIDSTENSIEVIDPTGQVIATMSGPKPQVASELFALISSRLL